MALTESQRAAIRHPIRWLKAEPEQPDELPRRELFSFTLGLWGQVHLNSMSGGDRFFHFCTNVLLIDPVTVGQMLGAKRMFDGLTDPVAGALVDNYRFKDGRKLLPWIKITAPAIAILAFLLFINWGLSPGLTLAYCIVIYMLADIFYSFHDAAIWGMTAAISPSADQRARATQWAEIGVFLGGLIPGLLLPMLGGGGAFGLTQQQVYFMFAAVLCLGGGFQSMFALRMTERVGELPQESTARRLRGGFRTIWRNIAALRHNHILLLFLASEVLGAFSPGVSDIYIYQQMSYNIAGREIQATLLVMIFGIVSGLPGSAIRFFATKIIDRVGGMKRLIIVARVAGIVVGILGFFIGVQTPLRLAAIHILGSISGLPGSVSGIAMRAMISDSVEYVEWKTDQRTEGITMSMRNLMAKIGGAIRSFIQGYSLRFLQFDAHLVENNLPQNAHFNRWVWPVHRLGPQIGAILGLIPLLMIVFPETLRRQVESEMAQRRALAEAKLQEEIAEIHESIK